jgi:transcriptional regulator with XRE-family HTH domain
MLAVFKPPMRQRRPNERNDMAKRPKMNDTKLGIVPPRAEDAPDPVDIHVGRRLRLRRGMLGISQTQLAQHVGLTFQAIQKYERGENRISASRLYQFAQILGVPVAYFFDELPNPRGGREPEPHRPEWLDLSQQEIHDILRAFSNIRHQRLRRSLIRTIKESAALSQGDSGAGPTAEPPPPPARPGGRRARPGR